MGSVCVSVVAHAIATVATGLEPVSLSLTLSRAASLRLPLGDCTADAPRAPPPEEEGSATLQAEEPPGRCRLEAAGLLDFSVSQQGSGAGSDSQP